MMTNRKMVAFALVLVVCATVFPVRGTKAQPVVGLDNWFNHEVHARTGKVFHYTWNDSADSGFSQLGGLFVSQGAALVTLEVAPSGRELQDLGVYIIVDPDTTRENPKPNYVTPADVKNIKRWVKRGGVLLLMANDGPNCEFTHFNLLAEVFGFRFVPVTLNPVLNRDWEMGAETGLPAHPLFEGVSKIYLKEVAPILLSRRARPVLKDGDDIFMAETNYGKGYVLAIGDPWLYNEYIGHSRLPQDFGNGKAAVNLTRHLLGKVR